MDALKPAVASTLEILSPDACEAIVSVAAFQPRQGPVRYYLNLRHASRRARGDQNLKLYVDDRGVLIHQTGKGMVSFPCREDRDAVLERARAHGITVEQQS